MKMRSRFLLACLLLATGVIVPEVAEASTTPSLSFEKGRTRVAFGGLPLALIALDRGSFTLAADYNIREDLSVGGVYSPWTYTGGRVVGRLTRAPDAMFKVGWSIEGGLRGTAALADGYGFPLSTLEIFPPNFEPGSPQWGEYYLSRSPDFGTVLHPAAAFSYEFGSFSTRFTIGPAWVMNVANRDGGLIYDHYLHVVFNPELAWRLTPGGELTLSGQGGLGWRQAF